jgi:hypothetical protein
MHARFIGQTYTDITFLTDQMPAGDEKHVASACAVSLGGNAVTAAFEVPGGNASANNAAASLAGEFCYKTRGRASARSAP